MHNRIIIWLILIMGFLLCSGGIGGLYSLYVASRNHKKTTGIVQEIHTKKEHRYRKIRYHSEMWITYSTEKYGTLSTTRASYYPFRKKGDKMPVWYHPEHPRDIRLPISECMLWGILLISGGGCIYVGMLFRKSFK